MAGEKNPKSAAASPRIAGGRITPVLVPQGALAGQPDVPLDRPVTTVGSNENARLHLVSRTVSKGHAIFVNSGGTTYVADMASRTGVLVNGKLVKDAELKTGDRVQIGKFVFRYRSPANTAPAVAAPESPAASVIVVGSPAVPAQGRTVIIGRRETSDIAIPGDAGVSSAHAVIFQMDGRWYMRDLASRTGTKVNGSPIHQQELKFGDRIVVGSTNILFQPGAAKSADPEDSFVPDIPMDLSDELGTEELPAEALPVEDMSDFAPEAVAEPEQIAEPESVAATEPIPVETIEPDDAIPLGDWRSSIAAEPGETPVDATTEAEAPLELEPESVPEPVAAEPEPAPVEVAEQLTEEAPVADEAEDDLIPLADEVPVAEPLPAEPAVVADDFALAGEAAIEAMAAPVPHDIKEATAVEAAEPAEVSGETVEAPEPAAAPIPLETAETALDVHEESVEAAELPEPVQVTSMHPEAAASAQVEPVARTPTPPSAPPAPVPALPIEHLLGDVEDFVFVPAAEHVDPNAVPEVIFWGDPELDSLTEKVVTQGAPTTVAPPAVRDHQPPADTDGESPGEDGPSDPPSDPPPVSPPGSTDSLAEPVAADSERSAPHRQTDYSAVAEIVPEHHGEPAVVLDTLPPLDETEVEATDQPQSAPVETDAVDDIAVLPEPQISVGGDDAAHLNAVVNVDLVEAPSIEHSARHSDVSVEATEIHAPAPAETPTADFQIEHVEAEHVPTAEVPTGELVAPVVDDRDEFFTPLSPALEEAFKAVRTWNDAPAEEDASPFEVIEPFNPEARASWEPEASPAAVDLLEPHESAEPIDLHPEVEPFDVEMTSAAEEPIQPAAAELEQPDVAAEAPAEISAETGDAEIEFPVLDSPTVSNGRSAQMSAVLNTDWVEPSVSLTSAEDAAIASAELDLPEITGVEVAPKNLSGTINVDLDTPVTVWAATQVQSAAAAEPLDVPVLDEIPAAQGVSAIADATLDTSVVAAPALARDGIGSAELHLPILELTEPLAATLNVELDAPIVASASSVEETGSTAQQELDLPHIDGVEPEAPAHTDVEATAEEAEFTPAAMAEDEIGSGGLELPAADLSQPADISGTIPEQAVLPDFSDVEPESPSITETPATTDFSGVVSADVDSVLDEPVEESIRMSEDGLQPTPAAAETAEPETRDDADLDFLDFGDSDVEPSAEKRAVVEPAPVPPELERPAVAPEKPSAAPRKGPSLFGFEFEGGSFLGGMPITLADKSAIPKPPTPVTPVAPPAPAAPAVPAASSAFDARATPPSGLGSMVAPAAAPVPQTPSQPPTPPRPTIRPSVPPPVARTPGQVTSLSGLVTEARSASGPPVIPPVVKAIAGNTAAAGVGLTGNTTSSGLASRNVEVFSQLSAPIGVEVFGGRPGNPDQFTVPDIKDTTEPEPAVEESAAEAQPDPALEYAAATEPARNVRWWRLPLWISLMIITPALAWVAAPHVVHEGWSFSGSLVFSGLKEQQPVDLHNFVETQKTLLLGSRSEEIRLGAEAILLKDGHPAGFTADPAQFAQGVQTQDFVFANDHVEFKVDWPDPVMARAQVDAVLLALAEKDQNLIDAKHQALVAADDAKANLDKINAELAKLTTEYHVQAEKASERPDGVSVSQNLQDVNGLTAQYDSAHVTRVNSESVLKDLKAQDPTKPIDPESDKEIVDLKKRLDLLNERIRIAKSKGVVNANSGTGIGTDVSVGATTQPDSAADPLLTAMQEEADKWSGKIQRRREELAAVAAIPADQRAVNLASAIENLSVKITGLQKSEDELKTQLDSAKLKAANYQKQIADATVAEQNKNQLYLQIQQKNAEKQAAADSAAKLETAYENAITVAVQSPARFLSVTNYRRTAVLVISILAWVLFGRLTLGELLRPRIVTGARPNAAPPANQPMRVIPWPEPHQLQGLKSDGA